MHLDPVILLAVALVAGLVWFISWRLIGIYLDANADPADSIQLGRSILLGDWARLSGDEVNGYLDSINVFHSHFYEAALKSPPSVEKVVVVRYVPDAFGRPLRSRLKGRPIKWWRKPDLLGAQVGAGRFFIWRRRGATEHTPANGPDALGHDK